MNDDMMDIMEAHTRALRALTEELGNAPTSKDIRTLTDSVDALSGNISKLCRALEDHANNLDMTARYRRASY